MQANVYNARIAVYKTWLHSVFNPDSSLIPVAEILKQDFVYMGLDTTSVSIEMIFEALDDRDLIIKYCEYMPQLKLMVTGEYGDLLPPPYLLLDKLEALFKKISSVFQICAQGKIFFSFNYVTHKMLQALGYEEYLVLVPMSMTVSRIEMQDLIWNDVLNTITYFGKHNILVLPKHSKKEI